MEGYRAKNQEYPLDTLELVEGIQRHALEAIAYYRENHEDVYDIYHSFYFAPNDLHNAHIPPFVREHIDAGFSLAGAEIAINSSRDVSSTIVTTEFLLQKERQNSNDKRLIRSCLPRKEAYADDSITALHAYSDEPSKFRQEIDDADLYRFVASLIAQNDFTFAQSYFHKPEDFQPYIHSSFAFNDVSAMLNASAQEKHSESHIKLAAPLAVLPTDIILSHADDSFIAAEIEFWLDTEQQEAISLLLHAQEGTDSTQLTYEKNGSLYTPTRNDFEEFYSRLQEMSQSLGAGHDMPTGDMPFDENHPPHN